MQALHRTFYLLFTSLWALAASASDALEPIKTLEGIEEYTLPSNGLRVLLMPNEGLPVATVMVTYKVGSRHENVGTTGAAHILEHMMFKGTPRFNREDQNDYSSIMERLGAQSNATTWFDRTNFYATLPSSHVPQAIELEADRMRHLLIRQEDLASEMTVVRNEYEQGENNPVQTLIKELFAVAFTAHTYGHPTIGWLSDIENITTEKLQQYYDKFYWPNNAVLTIIGGFDREQTLAAIAEHFGAISRSPHPIPELETVEPEQIGPRHTTIRRAGQVGIVMAGYKVPAGTHADWPALLLIDQIMGANRTGRLYRALEDSGKANATFTFAPELHDPGLFIFGAFLTPDATHEEVEAILLTEIDALIRGGVTEDELSRAKSVIRANTAYGRDGPFSIANQINEAIAMGDWTSYVERPQAIEAVTAQEIQAVAKRYFPENTRTTGWFIPEARDGLTASSLRSLGPNYYRAPADFAPQHNQAPSASVGNSPPVVNFSAAMQRASVEGIDLITVAMPIEGVVSFAGSFAAGESLSPSDRPMLAELTATMLDKGSARRDRFAIAELLNMLGADIRFSADNHSLQFSGRFLRPNAGTVLELLAEQLREPSFDPEVFETVRNRQKASLLQAVDNPGYRAGSQISRMLYPLAHPNRSEELDTLLADLERTQVEDLREFHQQYYGPESMRLVFAGDIDFEQIKAAVANAFDGWEGGVKHPENFPPQLENTREDERIFIADRTSVSVEYGYNTGLQRNQDAYLPFMLGNYILGGSFNSRLMSEIRKKRGLTYGIRSYHQGDLLTPGNWTLTASFSPDTLDKGLSATEEVLQAWHTNGVSEEETQAAIATLTGAYLVGLSTTNRVAAQIDSFLLRGMEPEYIDQYPLELREITASSVNQAIHQYLDPANAKRVVAGTLRNATSPSHQPKDNTVSVHLDTPNPSWRIQIEKIYKSGEELIAISRLTQTEPTADPGVTAVADRVEIATDSNLPVRHYIIGKTWDWGDTGKYTYIESMDAFGNALDQAEVIYSK